MKSRIKIFLFSLIFCAASQSAITQGLELSSQTQSGSFHFGGLERGYLYYIPSMAKYLNRELPLVLVLHGGMGKLEAMESLTFHRFDELADRDGFMVVYPAGVDGNWNDGRDDDSRAFKENIDDVGFISKLIQQFIKFHGADPKRVYVTGISNGAIFATRLACELSKEIAAVAPVAGSIPVNNSNSCRPRYPVSMLFINGDADPLVPFKGGTVHFFFRKRGQVIPVIEAVRHWALLDGCQREPIIERLPLENHKDKTWVERTTYPASRNGSEVLLYVIHGGGHTWPGGMKYASEWIVGKVSHQLDATNVIWDFFKRHSR